MPSDPRVSVTLTPDTADFSDLPRSVQVNLRLTPPARALMETIAREQKLLGGPGLKPEEPNVSAAIRYLIGRAEPRYRELDLSLEWDRSPQ